MKHILVLWISLAAVQGCGTGPSSENESLEIPPTKQSKLASMEEYAEAANDVDTSPEIAPQIIKTADIRMQVADFKQTTQQIQALAQQYKANITDASEYNNLYTLEGNMTIRVPAPMLDSLIGKVLTLSIYTQNSNSYSRDVTEEYIDLNARLKNKLEVEKKFTDLLKQAKTVTDVLAIENQLRQIREEIESNQGRLQYLQSQVAMSTLNLSYYQQFDQYQSAPDKSFGAKVLDRLKGGWQGFLQFLLLLTYLWPFLLLSPVVIWAIKRWRNRKKIEIK